MDKKLIIRVANRYLEERTAKKERVLVKNKSTGKNVLVKPETLKEEPGKYTILQEVPGRNPHGMPSKPHMPKDRPPEPPKYPVPEKLPKPKKPKKPPKPPEPVPPPEPGEPRKKKPLPGQKGWNPGKPT